jgi:hypothetical protein
MRPSKLHKPLGACSVCGALTNRHELLNHRCDKVVYGRRCYGTYKSSVTFLWDECEGCGGTGVVGTEVCGACEGFGWRRYA